jgi:hypothetical protein
MQPGRQIRRKTRRDRRRHLTARHAGEIYDASSHADDPRAKQKVSD